jgi:hypothetical protein
MIQQGRDKMDLLWWPSAEVTQEDGDTIGDSRCDSLPTPSSSDGRRARDFLRALRRQRLLQAGRFMPTSRMRANLRGVAGMRRGFNQRVGGKTRAACIPTRVFAFLAIAKSEEGESSYICG